MNHAQKLDLIDRVINAMVTAQLEEMKAKLLAAQAQTQALDQQYGKCRRPYAGGQ
ncbi:MAG: hypothetical protein KJ077_46030 [Anaerolineae bacterium]|nr:hypothetical protein [Anaerolineae bacterium]